MLDSLKRFSDFILRYKLLHIAYWLYALFSLTHIMQRNYGGSWSENFAFAANATLFQITCVYMVIYSLLPKYLIRQKYFRFVVFALISILIFSVLSAIGGKIVAMLLWHSNFNLDFILLRAFSESTDMAIVTGVFSAAVILQSKYSSDQLNRRLERERLEAELNFLKGQINPHFIFNVINSIYVLIEEDKKLASEMLLKFSGLLRYQLYECQSPAMPIERELNFLRDYIGLESIRNRENLRVVVDMSTSINHFEISPFILTPFVENAFKHVSHWSRNENYIRITADRKNSEFCFSVTNTTEAPAHQNGTYGGIGLENVKKRLNLIYPQRHTLNIIQQPDIYTVTLTIHVSPNELHHSGR